MLRSLIVFRPARGFRRESDFSHTEFGSTHGWDNLSCDCLDPRGGGSDRFAQPRSTALDSVFRVARGAGFDGTSWTAPLWSAIAWLTSG